jgi:geranylgeranyl diphosphate synthase type II
LIHALTHASAKQKEEMCWWFEQKTFDPALKIVTFKRIYDELGLKDITTRRIEDLYTKALCHLQQLNVPEERLSVLKEAGNLLLYRKS